MDGGRIQRRDFFGKAFKTAAVVLLAETILSCTDKQEPLLSETNKIVAAPAVYEINKWAFHLNSFCSDLDKGELTLTEWQDQLADLYGKIELEDILRFIDFERLIKDLPLPDLGVATKKVVFPKINGLPEDTVFVKKVFGMNPRRAIIPHGHSNMASGHLTLDGEFRLRQYDKISKTNSSLVLNKTVDKVIKAGDFSSISDDRNNVHWFIAGNRPAYTFDVIMLDLKGEKYDIHNLDMEAAEELADGRLEAPIMSVQNALSKYGKVTEA